MRSVGATTGSVTSKGAVVAERSVSVRLKAEVGGYMASLRTASRATRDFGNGVMERATRNRAEFETVGTALLGVGAAAVAGLAMATKAAIDWESAWAGVTKTVDGSAEQMAGLEGELREMARTLPATHEEIAGVAEAAGQLGIKREAIAGFTRTMIDLGNTTNLSADEAATAIAQFANVMGTSQGDVDRFGSALVALGNNSATTEADILSMASRMAGAGKLIGASESEILAMSAAMASVGITAEAGGGSMSRVMQQIYTAVNEGGDAVSGFARVAGMSAEQFATSFRENPVQAINSFVQGLNGVEASGGNVVGVLSELGIKSSEDLRTVLGLKGATDLLSSSLDISSKAWAENSALTEEAQQRYDTAASQIQVAWNQVKDAAIEVGGAIAPIVASIAGVVGDLASAFAALPGPVKSALGLLGGFGGVMALIAGGVMLALPRIAETRAAIEALAPAGGKARSSIVGIGKAAGVASLAFAGLQLAGAGLNSLFGNKIQANMEAFTLGLERWAGGAKLSGEAARVLGDDAEDLVFAFESLDSWTSGIAGFAQGIVGGMEDVSGSVANSEKRVAEFDAALASLVSGGQAGAAASVFEDVAGKLGEIGISADELRDKLPEYAAAQEVAADGAGDLAEGGNDAAGALGDVTESAESAVDALEAYAEAQRAAVDPVFALRSAVEQVGEAQQAYNEAVAEYGANSPAAEAAAWDLAEAVSGAEAAALNGELSFEAFKGKLAEWVRQGLITKGQADTLAGRVENLRGRAEDYKGGYNAHLTTTGTGAASSAISGLVHQLNGIPTLIPITIRTQVQQGHQGLFNDLNNLPRRATGGPIYGPGTGTSDTAGLFALSNGEHVLTAAEVQAAGGHGAIEVWRRSLLSPGRMADGGSVQPAGMRSGGAVVQVPAQRGGTTFVDNRTFSFPNYVGSKDELVTAIRSKVATAGGGDVQKYLGRR